MRNKVQLYIGGKRADLDDGSFILFTYTAEELTNPTIVRNSFSRQITLKGTPTNDEIFGHIYRNDRLTQYGGGSVGPDFDPTRKTPFTVYNEMGEILEDGYLKLNKVVRKGRTKEYAVTLYGGLGSFLYGLSYDANGEKLTLADLDYGQTLDFTIDRDAVADAWARLGGDTSKPAKWDIVNFIPGYMGLPSSPFDANKAIAEASLVGLPETDGEYSTRDGWCLATLAEKVTGNEAKDIRSYLQKPAVKASALINAICDPANNGGYTVNLDAEFFTASNPYWDKTWLTLPMLNDLNIDVSSSVGQDNFNGGTHTIPGGGNLSVLYNIWVDFALVGWGGTDDYKLYCEDDWAAGMQGDDTPGYYQNYIEWEVVAYDSNDAVINKFYYRVSSQQTPADQVQMDDTFDYIAGGYTFMKNGQVWKPNITIQGYGVAKVSVNMSYKGLAWGHLRAGIDANLMCPVSSYNYNDGVYFDCYAELQGSYIKYQLISSSTVRTGATITKAALLGGSNTPADYLLSFCKTFGLNLVCNTAEKTVDIVMRKNLYSATVVDINGRIDRGKEIGKDPFAFDARWYLFGNDAKGNYAEYFANKYGRPYGQFRVNTGYSFDATDKRLTDGIVFGNACEVMETSKYFCTLTEDGLNIPSVFLGGGKYALFKGGESKEYDIQYPLKAALVWENSSYPMHDFFPKMQFHGSENAHLDERDTLVFFKGMQSVTSRHVILSDDTRTMLSLNGNNPCWMLGNSAWELSQMPRFGRYVESSGTIVKSLDFGDPLELQIPGVTVGANSAIFPQYWEKYISDRYDDDSAVVTAWVDLRGMQVGENLLRQFYAFDGAVWALNRIIDHSLTTFGPTKCEFVKVQDITNYTTL